MENVKHWIIKAPDQPFDPLLAKPNRPFVSEKQAKKVASILALQNVGKRFVVYECQAVVVAGTVCFEL